MGEITESYKENKQKGEVLRIQCVECENETRHIIVQSLNNRGSEEIEGGRHSVDWSNDYQIVQCQGCMTVTYRTLNWFSEYDFGPDHGVKESLFPRRTIHTLPVNGFINVPLNLRRIYRETIECYNQEIFTLCAAGLRAIVEGLCAELNVSSGEVEIDEKGEKTKVVRKNLQGKIAGLHDKGYLTKQNSDILHEHRYLGNVAVHELSQPSRSQLGLAIEIIEHIFESVYEIPQKAYSLREAREKKTKARSN